MLTRVARVRIGTSGWLYPPWRGVFYPPGLPQRLELEHLSGLVDTVEINGSFYSLQRPESFAAWARRTPEDFLFAVKGPRFVTHMKQLRDVGTPLANFFASGVLALGPKLGPVLWQLPPRMRFDADKLGGFLEQLPRSTAAAAELAAGHDERLVGRNHLTTDADRPIRHAVEPRHESFHDPGFAALLREQGVATVIADSAGTWPTFDQVTSDLVYLRMHGYGELYAGGYPPDALDAMAERMRGWRDDGLDVVAYFDNDAKVHAPHDAISLAGRLAA
ncbi:DUF72 domain-containing protein [Pseudonocardia lacus]|uniref:DUF72 domain-containing protein n=1 Tax=Pseudonocardia lacus TaxID=2835865 RepID=UPI001BDD417F|nr:DUF72 domain-containing protein [Pseudonocardia lacus]